MKYLESEAYLDENLTQFFPRLFIFHLQQKVLKCNDFSVSWRSTKTDLETNILNRKIEVLRMSIGNISVGLPD